MTEIWKDIENFEGLYQISSKGRIRRITKTRKKLLKLYINTKNGGYYTACLCKNNKRTHVKVHQIVAKHFISNPDNFIIMA